MSVQRARHAFATRLGFGFENERRAASGDKMLLDAIATVILAAMMFIPLVNVVVGAFVGAGLSGLSGGAVGIMLAIVITLAEKMIGDWRAGSIPLHSNLSR